MTDKYKQHICISLILLCVLFIKSTSTLATDVKKQEHNHESMQYDNDKSNILSFNKMEGATANLITPDLTIIPLEMIDDKVALPSTKVGNYHAIVIEKTIGKIKNAVIQYKYFRGKPSAQSPTKLMKYQKTDFEIVPDPIPREHMRYLSNEEWSFVLLFKGKVVPNNHLHAETENGSLIHGLSDKNGRFKLKIPEDFPNIKKGERSQKSAGFNLIAEHKDGENQYKTILKSRYSVNPSHWRSLEFGLITVTLGFLLGLIINRLGVRNRSVK